MHRKLCLLSMERWRHGSYALISQADCNNTAVAAGDNSSQQYVRAMEMETETSVFAEPTAPSNPSPAATPTSPVVKADGKDNATPATRAPEGESGLLKAMRALSSKSPPVVPNTCLCSLNGAAVTCAAVDAGLNNIAYSLKDLNAIECLAFKDFRRSSEATVVEKGIRLRGHSDTVTDISFLPESPYLLSSSTDCSLRLWDSSRHVESHLKATYTGHMYPVWSLCVSPFSLYFASASADTTAKLWTTDRLFPIRIFASHSSDVNCVRFHPNCNYVATASTDRSVRMWSVNDAKCIRMFPGHKAAVFSLSFSPDGQFLASAGDDDCIKVWDLRSSHLIKEMRAHTETISFLEWNADGSLLASSSLDSSLKLWDTSSLTPTSSSKAGGEKKWTSGGNSQFGSTPLSSVDTKGHRVIKTRFSNNNILFAFGLK